MSAQETVEGVPVAGRRRAGRRVGAVLSSVLLTVLVAVALVMIVVPAVLGATPYTVLTASMEPSIPPGSLVVVRPVRSRTSRWVTS